MTTKNFKHHKGLSLIGVMISIFILSVAVIGAAGYRYYAALDARKAATGITAARIATLLCESWRGVKGAETYDPAAHLGSDLAISGPITYEDFLLAGSYSHSHTLPTDLTVLGVYTVTSSNVDYDVILAWKDIATGLRALNVVVTWPLRERTAGAYGDGDVYKSFELVTYTTN